MVSTVELKFRVTDVPKKLNETKSSWPQFSKPLWLLPTSSRYSEHSTRRATTAPLGHLFPASRRDDHPVSPVRNFSKPATRGGEGAEGSCARRGIRQTDRRKEEERAGRARPPRNRGEMGHAKTAYEREQPIENHSVARQRKLLGRRARGTKNR